MITFLAGMIGIVTAIAGGTLVLFIIATIVAGSGQGIAISAATRGLLHGSTLADRAPRFVGMLCAAVIGFVSEIRPLKAHSPDLATTKRSELRTLPCPARTSSNCSDDSPATAGVSKDGLDRLRVSAIAAHAAASPTASITSRE
jgi:hypothetical protein